MAENTFDTHSGDVLEALVAGVSIADAAQRTGIASRTIDRWLARGRSDPESKYGPFAEKVDSASEARSLPPRDDLPADHDELRLLVSGAARKGNVQAMRLLHEIQTGDSSAEAVPGDILDELEARRRSKTA